MIKSRGLYRKMFLVQSLRCLRPEQQTDKNSYLYTKHTVEHLMKSPMNQMRNTRLGLMNGWLAVLLSAIAAQSLQAQVGAVSDTVLRGVIDTHVHTEEEYAVLEDGSMDMIDLARRAKDKGMRALVVKSLKFETATRAYLTSKQVPGIAIFGGLSLDLSVGGANPEAVEALGKLKLPTAKVVWMPVFDSKAGVEASGEKRKFAVVSENGQLTPNTIATIDAVAKYGFSLATSHLGADEALLVVRAARTRNIPVVVTHAAQSPVLMSVEQMKEVARLGGFIEHTAFGHFKGPQSHYSISFYKNTRRVPVEEVVRLIKEVGVEQTILATDLGQAYSPIPPDGFKWFILSLKRLGITDAELDIMTRRNPARFLGLEAAGLPAKAGKR